ncbi:MAG TPA: hypothetical protein VFT22_08885, partial [Kofleriaceae bacterium]|nr:hypothetical protein [Kofleriaceae bacterium]
MTHAQDRVRSDRWWLAALIGCAAALGCHAAAGPSGPSARSAPSGWPDALARCRAVSGGARWDAGFAIASTAEVSVGGMSGTSESIEDTRTGRHKATLRLGDGLAMSDGFDGAAWEQAIGGEIVTPDAPDAVALAATMRWMTARGYLRAGGARYRELGARALGDRRFHAVEAAPPGGAPIELWLDDATGLLARTVHRDGTNTVTTSYDDYRAVDGVTLPHLTVVDPGDPRNRATFRVTGIRLRPAVADSELARPRTDERLTFAGGAHATRLPFDLINNHIYIHARVDGQPVRMLVDTGGLNLLTPAAAARLGLASAGKLAGAGVGERK